jgi:hypothetical protein
VLPSFTSRKIPGVAPRAIVGLESEKNAMTSSGIEPVTFRLVEQCLNLLRYCVPCIIFCIELKLKKKMHYYVMALSFNKININLGFP